MRTPSPALAHALALLAAAMMATGCGKAEPKKPKIDFLAKPKYETFDIFVEPPPDPTSQPTASAGAETWATKIKGAVAEVQTDLARCRNEFLVPFQFQRMKRRDVEFVNFMEMDDVCVDGNREAKKRGPKRIVAWLAEEHIGKHVALDRWIALASEQVEAFAEFSFMCKKVGAPDLTTMVVPLAEADRNRIIQLGPALDRAAADIAKWGDGQVADDDPAAVGLEVELVVFRKQLFDAYGFFVGDGTAAYDRAANKAWQGYNMARVATMKRWLAIPTKRLQQDRARLRKVTGADDAARVELAKYLDTVAAAVQATDKAFARYVKTPKAELEEKDPARKGLVALQAAVVKQHAAWGLAEPAR
ncbi:MAG: hypothetical protein EXR79_10115 [Myxococcales bacterium]|nr:hypothetical protein [Myxococcales bacterium]